MKNIKRSSGENTAEAVEEPADAERVRLTPVDSHSHRARVATPERHRLHERRVVLPDDKGPAVAAYRMLRTQLLRQIRAHDLRTIGIVGAADGEGKTLTAVNLALCLAAEPNQTVLLVDLDLRRPNLATLLELPARQGMEAWFTGRAAIDDLFWRLGGMERLSILPAMAPLAGSSELLAGARVKDLMHELKTRYPDRLVLFDLPPMLLTDDVLTILPSLDGVVIVATEGRTRREDLERMRELLGPVRLIGTVLNCASQSEQRSY